MKKIMILGAAYSQIPLIMAAKKLGFYTIVASIPGDYKGFTIADEVCHVDISNPEKVLIEAKKHKIDGIVTCCMDIGLRAQGYVCTDMDLIGPSKDATYLCTDKSLMKEAFVRNGVQTAKHIKICSKEELLPAMEQLKFPLILKAVDLMGSRGIMRCDTREEVLENYATVMSATQKTYCLLEEFIEGTLFGVEAMVKDRKLVFALPDGTTAFEGFTPTPIGHYIPAPELNGVEGQIADQVRLVVEALGFNNTPVNCDFIRRGDQVYVVEATARAGATCLPELVSLYYGVDYYEQLVRLAMGLPLDEQLGGEKKCGAVLAHVLVSEKTGMLIKLQNRNLPADDVLDISFNVTEGDLIRAYTNGRDRLGQIIVKGDSYDSCKERLADLLSNIVIELGPM